MITLLKMSLRRTGGLYVVTAETVAGTFQAVAETYAAAWAYLNKMIEENKNEETNG